MARITSLATFLGTQLTLYTDTVAETTSNDAIKIVSDSLKAYGPYWSGEFEAAWVAKKGTVPIKADKKREQGPRTRKERRITPLPSYPGASKKNSIYSFVIGNLMEYRLYAMDLLPIDTNDGVLFRGDFPGQTSPLGRDWYRQYTERLLKRDLAQAFFGSKDKVSIKGPFPKNNVAASKNRFRFR